MISSAAILSLFFHLMAASPIEGTKDFKRLSEDFLLKMGAELTTDCVNPILATGETTCGKSDLSLSNLKGSVQREMISRGWVIEQAWWEFKLRGSDTKNAARTSAYHEGYTLDLVAISLEIASTTLFLRWEEAWPPESKRQGVRPIYLTEDMAPPKRTKFVKPHYPESARKSRIEGKVILEIVVGVKGNIENLRILKSNSTFDRAATEAVRKWKYEPARSGGKPVKVFLTVIVEFNLR